MPNEPLLEQGLNRAELLAARNLRVNAMKLPQPDLLESELLQALVNLSDQVFGSPIRRPIVRTGPFESAFGRNQHALVGVQRLVDQFFREVGAVGIGGVDKVTPTSGTA